MRRRSGRRRRGLALAVIATAQLMVVPDATIVNVALPEHPACAALLRDPTWNGSLTRTPSPSAGCCCSAAGPATCSGGAGSSSSASCSSPSPRCSAGSPPARPGCSAARALQGVGGAFAAPTALALIVVHVPSGPRAEPGDGRVCGDEHLRRGRRPDPWAESWSNTPTGGGCCSSTCRSACSSPFLAPRVLGESERRSGRFDLPGAITGKPRARRPGLRPVQRGDQLQRGVALG